MSAHSYSIKLFQNNFITLLHLYEFLNYESSSMRNDYIFFKNNVIALAKKLRNKKEKIKMRNYRILRHRYYCGFKKEKSENAKLSNIEASSSIIFQRYNLIAFIN